MSVLTTPPAPAVSSGPAAAERSRAITWTAAAIGTIWLAVVLISVFAPDNVSGAPNMVTGEQEHVPIAAILTWIWGLLASRNVATAIIARRREPDVGATARLVALAVIPIWIIATAVGVFGPELVTGTDPTHVPISAILAPIAAMVVTGVVIQLLTALDDDAEKQS